MKVGGGVAVGMGVTVAVWVAVGVLVGVLVSVGEAVKEGITKDVKVGIGVEEGRRVGFPASGWSLGVGVHVGGIERRRGVTVAVGIIMARVGRRVGGGKGLKALD